MTLMVFATLSVRIPDHKMCQPELSIENINTFLIHSRSVINQFLHLKHSTDHSLVSTTEGSIEAFDEMWDRSQSILYKILKITDTAGDRYFNMGMSLELIDILKSRKALGSNKVPNDHYATYGKKSGYFKPSFYSNNQIQGLICNVDPTNEKETFIKYQQMILVKYLLKPWTFYLG